MTKLARGILMRELDRLVRVEIPDLRAEILEEESDRMSLPNKADQEAVDCSKYLNEKLEVEIRRRNYLQKVLSL